MTISVGFDFAFVGGPQDFCVLFSAVHSPKLFRGSRVKWNVMQ
jgi:hypothetical protein